MKKLAKFLIPAILCMAMLLIVSGCQNKSSASSETPAHASEVPSAEPTPKEDALSESKEASATRTVTTVMGDVEVPANPQRVVVNWYVGDVFALDLNVVGYYCWAQESMPFYDKMMATTAIENWEPEEVMALEPDLIITYKEEDFDKFKSIAPVIVVRGSDMNSLERVQFLGKATGTEDKAEEVLNVFETKLEDAKKLLSGEQFEGKTFTINEDWGSTGSWAGITFERSSRGGTLVFKYLGMKLPEKTEELIDQSGDRDYALLSYEVAHEYFGDYIIWFDQEGSESEYKKTEIWNSIPAVTNENIITIPGEKLGMFYFSDILSLTAEIDYIVDAINHLAK